MVEVHAAAAQPGFPSRQQACRARPNAHHIILAIAAHCLALAGRVEEGKAFAAMIRTSLPNFSVDDFLATFRFPPETEALFRAGANKIRLGSAPYRNA